MLHGCGNESIIVFTIWHQYSHKIKSREILHTMAPNRNDLKSSSLHSLQSLDLSEQFKATSKYQALIPPAAYSESKQSTEVKSVQDSNDLDYWHMPADEDKDYFSIAHLEKMLVQDVEHLANQQSKNEYLDTRNSGAGSYWDWSAAKSEVPISKSALIETIMKEESIRQMLTCDHIGRQETQYHHSKKAMDEVRPDHCNSMHESDSYFYFPPPQEDKNSIINRILKEEESRQILLTENIVKNLASQSNFLPPLEESKEAHVSTCRNSDNLDHSYWSW